MRYIFCKKGPNFEIVWPAPATPRALTVKGVYEVSYSWYGQINGGVYSTLPSYLNIIQTGCASTDLATVNAFLDPEHFVKGSYNVAF